MLTRQQMISEIEEEPFVRDFVFLGLVGSCLHIVGGSCRRAPQGLLNQVLSLCVPSFSLVGAGLDGTDEHVTADN